MDGRRGRAGRIGAANRDPAVFPDPDRLDLERKPALHASFAHGAHYCLGAPLSRREARIALPAILRRCPELQLTEPAALEPAPGYFLHGVVRLPLQFRAS